MKIKIILITTFLIFFNNIIFSQNKNIKKNNKEKENPEEKIMIKIFKERIERAHKTFKNMKIKRYPIKPKPGSILNKFKSPKWLTEEEKIKYKKEYWKRYKKVMEEGEKFNTPIGYTDYYNYWKEKYQKIEKEKKEEKRQKSNWYYLIALLLIITLSFFIIKRKGLY